MDSYQERVMERVDATLDLVDNVRDQLVLLTADTYSAQARRSAASLTICPQKSVYVVPSESQQLAPAPSAPVATTTIERVQTETSSEGVKRKIKDQTENFPKRVKRSVTNEAQLEEEDDDEGKLKIVVLKMNCTEPGCKSFLKSADKWKEHLSTHHNKEPYKQLEDNVQINQIGQMQFFCSECKIVFRNKPSIVLHWRKFHHAGKFKCSACAYVANFRYKIYNHQMRIHLDRNFDCEECEYSFQNKFRFDRHVKSHRGLRPFACTWKNCLSTFLQRSTAVTHIRVRHFKLPASVKEQLKNKLFDDRDPNEFIFMFEVDPERNGQVKPLGQVKEYIHQEELDKSGRVFFNGDYYDDVVPIILHGLKYRVAFNRNLDPWLVAADFVAFNHLESTDLQPVVKAIVTTVKYAPKRNAKDVFSDASEFPLSAMVLFDSPPNWDKFKAKFLEFHDALEDGALKLDPAKFAVVNAEFNDPGRNSQVFVDCYVKLFNWPNKSRFVVYDLFRLNLSNQYFASYCLHHLPNIQSAFDSILAATKEQDLGLQLTALRCLVNLFSTVHGAEHMYRSFDHIQQSLVAWDGLMDNRNVHLAYSAIWFNYSVLLIDVRKQQNIGYLNGLMGVVADGDGKSKHSDAVVQMLNTFGNLLVAGGRSWRYLRLVRNYMKVVQSYPKTFDVAYDVKRAVQQINRL